MSAAVRSRAWPWSSYKDFALDKVHADWSHCLVEPEIRNEKDKAASCDCRDAIADARYVYFTYILPGQDRNLSGPFLVLNFFAIETCGEDLDVHKVTTDENWKWTGPEVVRTYPPDSVIRQIKPNSHGLVPVEYTVVLIHRDSAGNVTKTESFSALDLLLASDLKAHIRAPRQMPPKPQQ